MILNSVRKLGIRLSLCIAFLVFTQAYAQQFNPQVQSIVDEVSIDSLLLSVQELSGEIPTRIGDSLYTITSRNRIFEGNEKAAIYLKQKLESFGLPTSEQDFVPLGRNIFAVQMGTVYPDSSIIFCAHYDSMPVFHLAPGADDNASGTAAVLEAARILSKYHTKYTIIYALWDNEENGKLGSAFYAGQAYSNNENILGVLNLDMIGWDSDDDGRFEVHTNIHGNSIQQANEIVAIKDLYNLDLGATVYNPGTDRSDHDSFWQQGYSANMVTEGLYSGDFNENYHTSEDKVEFFNTYYFHNLARLSVATIASWAEIGNVVSVEENKQIPLEYFLLPNYPNPFNPETTISFVITNDEVVKINIYNVYGQLVKDLVNAEVSAGRHHITWNGNDNNGHLVSSGLYFYRMETSNFNATKQMLLLR